MKPNSILSRTIAAILAGSAAAATAPAVRAADAEESTEQIAEITVTAQRRSESMQDVPISMQALTEQALQQLNVSTFDDYLKFLPSVTSASNGPGQNEVFMRGVSAGSQASQGSGSTGLWPNVAIYLDNQSVQLPNRNLDVYAADLNRIEVLEGPQGTLFGAGAQAGAIRYITNEPKLDKVEANVKAGYGTTAHGDDNDNLEAMVNLPLIDDHMAVRAVIYSDHRGGYIDNVPATFARKDTDLGIALAAYSAVNGVCPDHQPNNGYCVPPGSPTLNNYSIAGSAINPVTYEGLRVEVLYKFNDDWDLLISQSYQDMDSRGVFYQQPFGSQGEALQPLEVTLFNSAYDKDKFSNTAWTVDGKIGSLKAVYTGGYLSRRVDQVGDYTNYARGVYADYYQCAYIGIAQPVCYSPSSVWRSEEQNEHFQNELRFSTPDELRLRGIAGVYYEDNKLYDQTAWLYKTLPACTATVTTGCLTDVGTIPGTTVQNPGIQSDNTSFYQDQVRETKQTAFFGSFDFDLIPKQLTLTAGTRYFRFENSMKGSVLSSFGCYEFGPPPCYVANSPDPYPAPSYGASYYSYNLDYDHLSDTETGWRSRANLTWHIVPDAMVYYTFSQGFRPGGFNQNGGSPHAYLNLGPPSGGSPIAPNQPNPPQYLIPRSYSSDNLTNNEIGWKTEFLDHRVLFNGAIYREKWNNVQIEFFNPGVVGNLFYDTNGQDFLIKGIETQVVARVVTGLTLQAAANWNQSEQQNAPSLLVTNPYAPRYGQPITNACNLFFATCQAVSNPFGTIGSPTANSPPLHYSLGARYEWAMAGGYAPFLQFGATHNGHSFTQAGANPTYHLGGTVSTSRGRFENPAYSTFDASAGVSKDAWYFTLSCENLSNSNASTFVSSQQFITAQTPLRPRVIMGTVGYKF